MFSSPTLIAMKRQWLPSGKPAPFTTFSVVLMNRLNV
jgi:hypothetical protein